MHCIALWSVGRAPAAQSECGLCHGELHIFLRQPRDFRANQELSARILPAYVGPCALCCVEPLLEIPEQTIHFTAQLTQAGQRPIPIHVELAKICPAKEWIVPTCEHD